MLASRELRSTVHPATDVLPTGVYVALVCDVVIGGVTRAARVVLVKMRCGRDVSVQVVGDLCGSAGQAVLVHVVALGGLVMFELAVDASLKLTRAGEMALRALQDAFVDGLAVATAVEPVVEFVEVGDATEFVEGVVNVVAVERMLYLCVQET